MAGSRLALWCLAAALGGALASPRILDAPAAAASDIEAKYRLPKGFLFGSGTSSYQTEGAWDADGKGVNVFDHYYHSKNLSVERTGDVSADAYHRYKEDLDIAASLGLNVFRLSISWARIFPKGRNEGEASVNKAGVQHYHDVLDYMKKKNIEPTVTLFHFDYPQALEDEFGGWLSDKMPEVFASYADFMFNEYGSKVKLWLTINEASMYCNLAGGMVPPMTVTNANKPQCLHNLIVGHALAHKIYHDKYKAKYNGMVGFGVGPSFSRPASDAAEDVAAAEKSNMGSGLGLSIDPLVFGRYPAEAGERPAFTDEQKELLKVRRIDWAGVNIYNGRNASASGGGGDGPPGDGGGPPGDGGSGGGGGPPGDGGSGGGGPPGDGGGPPGDGGSGGGGPPGDGGGPPGDGGGPDGGGGGGGGHGSANTESAWVLRELPKWVKSKYGDLPVFITENGLSVGTVDDWETRAVYSSAFLRELIAGINEDKNNVIGYTSWSFIDSFEFFGSGIGWGMVTVDYQNGTLKRTPKQSSTFFKTLTRKWAVPLVEAGSQPFPDPDASAGAGLRASAALAALAALAARLAMRHRL